MLQMWNLRNGDVTQGHLASKEQGPAPPLLELLSGEGTEGVEQSRGPLGTCLALNRCSVN